MTQFEHQRANNFEHGTAIEIEQKRTPHNPEELEHFKSGALPIEQIYLSSPEEPCSLRVREKIKGDGTPVYTATLKTDRELGQHGVERKEYETPIDPSAYRFLSQIADLARLRKLRAEPEPGVTIDWFEGLDTPLIEIEQGKLTASSLALAERLASISKDVSEDPEWENESIAHRLHPFEAREPKELRAQDILSGMVADLRAGYRTSIATIAGLSGSGKSTLAREVATLIESMFPDHSPALVISTDDYHRGKSHLDASTGEAWRNWDSSSVYDTGLLSDDIKRFVSTGIIRRRRFDFSTQEPTDIGDFDQRTPFIIIEGICGRSADLDDIRTRHYDMPTPIATSLLRDLTRIANRPSGSIGTPEERLAYMINTGIPTYLQEHEPPHARFSASIRPIGDSSLAWLKY